MDRHPDGDPRAARRRGRRPGRSADLLKLTPLHDAEAEVLGELAGLDGDTLDMLLPQKLFPGNQPSTTIILPRIDAYHLGMLLAMYEHKVFVQGVIWGINSFDQWGVELGKQLAGRLLPALKGETATEGLDQSTSALIGWCREYGDF